MKLLILGGFLGAGKTSLILQLAPFLTRRSSANDKTSLVILENEISDAGVDNQFLAEKNFTVSTIFSGCICCSGSSDLSASVKAIEKIYKPEWLLIEASGLAYPDVVKERLQKAGFKDSHVIALADAKRWKRTLRAMRDFAESQLSCADLILINKADLVTSETLSSLAAEIKKINPLAKILPFTAIQQYPDDFWDRLLSDLIKEEVHCP